MVLFLLVPEVVLEIVPPSREIEVEGAVEKEKEREGERVGRQRP